MNSSTSQEPKSGPSPALEAGSVPSEPNNSPNTSMEEYYSLQKELIVTTVTITGIIFISVWILSSPNLALNYLLGACVGVVYLRMLAKDVEALGRQKNKLGQTRMALFIGLIIVATQLNELKILPIFLGFLTYKASIVVYALRTTLLPSSK